MRIPCAVGTIGLLPLFLFLPLFLLLLLAVSVDAAPAVRDATTIGPEDLPRIQLLSSSGDGLDLRFDLPTLAVEEFTITDRRFQVVAIPGGGLLGDVGRPGIPTFTRLISIPDGVSCSIRVVPEDEVEMTGYDLMPVQADEGPDFSLDKASYAIQGYDAAPLASVGSPAITRDLRVVPITFRPVRFDPSRHTLKVAQRMRAEVRFTGSDPRNPWPTRRNAGRIPASFDRLYRELVVNYAGPPNGGPASPGSYLVICPDSSEVIARLQPLLDWRTRMGYSVRLATTFETGMTPESIKSFIQNVYDTATVPLEYVCLIGDAANSPYVVPTCHESLSGFSGEGDHEYTLLAGDDALSDVHIGRLSFESLEELETEVAKSVGYESSPDMQDTSWFKRACLVGDPRYGTGSSAVQVQQWIKARLRVLGYAEIDTVFSSLDWIGTMQSALNRGDTIFSYRGMLMMSGWTNSNTYLMTNGWKLPFCVTITCETGSFESDPSCRTEGFLRAGSPTEPKGAVGAIGTATGGTHTRFNNCMHMGIFYGLLYAGQTTMGGALTRGKYEMYLNYGMVDPNRVYIWSTWNNLMGDPAVDIFLDIPGATIVDGPSSIPIGSNVLTLLAHDEAGAPIPNALVCLYKGTETYATGYTGSDGAISLPIHVPTSGELLVTVTKHNRVPYIAPLPVIDPEDFVAYQASTIDDDGEGESAGDGDGVIDSGETIEMPVEVRNFGSHVATGVSGTLSSADPYVTVLGGSQSFGDLDRGSSAWSSSGFVFRVDPSCPDRHAIRLSLDLTGGTGQWRSIIDLATVSADLVADSITIYGDGRIFPGDSAEVSIRLANVGGGTAENPIATLSCASRYIEIPDSAGTYPSIPPNGSGENEADRFTIHATSDCIPGLTAEIRIRLSFSNGQSDTAEVRIPIGSPTSSDPTGPDAHGYSAFDDADISYNSHPTYEWIEIDPTLGGTGSTQIVLGDTGDEQDKSRVVDIPFTFKYYGEEFDRGTVCSNGWLAMGSTYLTDYRNWTLPSGCAPDRIIAIFWDELFESRYSRCCQRYDPIEGRWIVEWSRFRDAAGLSDVESFEVILYDPARHQTDTGDGKILMQYRQVANNDVGDGYATVGIQNADHTSGLCYTYFNRYSPGASVLATGRAILFTTPEPIGPFALIAPAAGESIHTVTPELRWRAARAQMPADTVRYSLFWSTNADFSGADSAATGTDTTYTFPPGALHIGATYHWRVRATVRDRERTSDPMAGWSFFVVDDNTPCLILPEALGEEDGILLTWKAPVGYDMTAIRVHRRVVASEWRPLTPLLPVTREGFRYLDADAEWGVRYEYALEAFGPGGPAGWYGPVGAERLPPGRLSLRLQPNPGRDLVNLTFTSPRGGDAVLRLFDLQGREAARRTFGGLRPGTHRVAWRPRDAEDHPLPSGGYYIRLETTSGWRSARWVLIR